MKNNTCMCVEASLTAQGIVVFWNNNYYVLFRLSLTSPFPVKGCKIFALAPPYSL